MARHENDVWKWENRDPLIPVDFLPTISTIVTHEVEF